MALELVRRYDFDPNFVFATVLLMEAEETHGSKLGGRVHGRVRLKCTILDDSNRFFWSSEKTMFLANIHALCKFLIFFSVTCRVFMCDVFLSIGSCSKAMFSCINIHMRVCYFALCWFKWKLLLQPRSAKTTHPNSTLNLCEGSAALVRYSQKRFVVLLHGSC